MVVIPELLSSETFRLDICLEFELTTYRKIGYEGSVANCSVEYSFFQVIRLPG